jgi:hypothetical protein
MHTPTQAASTMQCDSGENPCSPSVERLLVRYFQFYPGDQGNRRQRGNLEDKNRGQILMAKITEICILDQQYVMIF